MSANRSASQEPPTKVLTRGLITTFLDPFFRMCGIERDDMAETGEALAVCAK